MSEVYLDNAATTPVHEAVVEKVSQVLRQGYGNPSSLHPKGLEAERLVQSARDTVARVLGVSPAEVVFTSGGTEANNLALLGWAAGVHRERRHAVTTAVEHPSVLEPLALLERSGWEVTRAGVTEQGLVDLAQLQEAVGSATSLVSTMQVNNETGAVQPLEEVSRVLGRARPRPCWHVDAVQGLGKVELPLRQLPIDLVTVSAHKLHGPKGCGALIQRGGVNLEPRVFGGGQENGMRAGTENVPGIVGFAQALRLLQEDRDAPRRMRELKEYLWNLLRREVADIVVNGPWPGAPHILNVSVPGMKAEVLVHALAQEQIYVSSGSACASRSPRASHVLQAMGVGHARQEGALRFGLSSLTTRREVEQAAGVLGALVRDLARFHRR